VSALALLGCEHLVGGAPPATANNPIRNAATSRRMNDVPPCPGGDRAQACVLGEVCQVTDQGCQVCQCRAVK